jgi:hypothetical protein
MICTQRPLRRVAPRELKQMITLVLSEPQTASDRGKHLVGRLRPALLLQPCEVVHAHPAQGRHFLTPQPFGAATGPAG